MLQLPETLKYAEYVSVFTTVNRRFLKAEDVLGLYRCRWQIELVFKRLKSIIGLGHLPKHNKESCAAWLHGKLFVALLIERLYQGAEFFPRGGILCNVPNKSIFKERPRGTRSPWREFEFWFMVLQHTVVPRLFLSSTFKNWAGIRKKLMENCRTRNILVSRY
ncbi:MAG: transposase [Desulfobacteraceae bacterium]|nr:transposase [Desulfobacteraceae bacterium]